MSDTFTPQQFKLPQMSQQGQQSYTAPTLPELPKLSDVREQGFNYGSLRGPAMMAASQFIPGLGLAGQAFNLGSGIYGGYKNATQGNTDTAYSMGDGMGGTFTPKAESKSLLGEILSFSPTRFVGEKFGGLLGSAFGNSTIDVPQQQPAPQMASQPLAPLQSDRPLPARNIQPDMTAAMQSLQKAYGSPSRYDPSRGWVETAPTQSAPQQAAPPPDLGGTFGNGTYSPWYGDTNPYSATGNMNMQTSAYGGQWVNNPNYDPNWWMYGADGINHGNQPGS